MRQSPDLANEAKGHCVLSRALAFLEAGAAGDAGADLLGTARRICAQRQSFGKFMEAVWPSKIDDASDCHRQEPMRQSQTPQQTARSAAEEDAADVHGLEARRGPGWPQNAFSAAPLTRCNPLTANRLKASVEILCRPTSTGRPCCNG
jgi:hypothetical protein